MELYQATASRLVAGLYDGLGAKSFDYGSGLDVLKPWLERNIYAFSAAKSLTELEQFRSMMTNPDGSLKPYAQFRDEVARSGAVFNKRHLLAEYNNAQQSGVMARKWTELTAVSEYLEYSTAGDDRVRPKHSALDGLTLHRDSPVWNRIWPPNDWNCRCDVIPGIPQKASTDSAAGKLAKGAVEDPLFENNVGKSQVIYKDGHPYFVRTGFKDRQLDAVAQYGMKPVEKIMADAASLPAVAKQETVQDYLSWWDAQVKMPDTDDILLQDPLGNKVRFDSWESKKQGMKVNYFRDHLLKKAAENRHEYAANFPDVLQNPDEVWTGKEKGNLVHFYVKYYDDAPYVIVVNAQKDGLLAESFYRLKEKRATQVRRGILLFRK